MKCLLLALLLFSLVARAAAPDPEDRERHVRDIAKVIPVLEELRVTRFQPTFATRMFRYKRGKFWVNDPPDEQAVADAGRLQTALDGTEAKVIGIDEARYSPQGKLIYAAFNLPGYFSRFYYVYSPHYGTLPQDQPQERTHTRINDDWYLMWVDWN